MNKHPMIEHEGKKLYQIGCRSCRRGHAWKIYSDGKTFIAFCKCGHHIDIKPDVLQRTPNREK